MRNFNGENKGVSNVKTTATRQFLSYVRLSLFMMCGFISVLAPALAQPPSASSPHRERLERLFEEIGLDDKTLTEVRKILDASKTDRQELHHKLREAYAHMRLLLEQPQPDESAIMVQADIIGGLRTEARKQRLRTLIQVRALLTPEQRAKLLALRRVRHASDPCGPRSPTERGLEESEDPSIHGNP